MDDQQYEKRKQEWIHDLKNLDPNLSIFNVNDNIITVKHMLEQLTEGKNEKLTKFMIDKFIQLMDNENDPIKSTTLIVPVESIEELFN